MALLHTHWWPSHWFYSLVIVEYYYKPARRGAKIHCTCTSTWQPMAAWHIILGPDAADATYSAFALPLVVFGGAASPRSF